VVFKNKTATVRILSLRSEAENTNGNSQLTLINRLQSSSNPDADGDYRSYRPIVMSKPIEITVHSILRDLLRHQTEIQDWNHHLTMARLVARTLRLDKSALIQTGIATHRLEGKYRIGYLLPALLWHEAVIIAIPTACHPQLINAEIPLFQQWLNTDKPIYCGTQSPPAEFRGLWMIDPRDWLDIQLHHPQNRLNYPTIIDGADDLAYLAQQLLTIAITPEDWDFLRVSQTPSQWQSIGEIEIQLMEKLWQRPQNPYNCYLLDAEDRSRVVELVERLSPNLPDKWQAFNNRSCDPKNELIWATIDRTHAKFTLSIAPINPIERLAPIWQQQASVLITSAVDLSKDAIGYRQEIGLGELTSVKFLLDRQTDIFQLYIPRWMPMPNTPKFQPILVDEIEHLLYLICGQPKFVVILIGDTPLQAQIAAILAAEWGSRVQVEQTDLNEANILISGWEFWHQHQDDLPTPKLMIIPTLPIPSLEDPLVAAKVNFYKQQKQDWFRFYLLPTGLKILHRSIAPIRSSQGVVAIFDNRINQRSYGQQVLAALAPAARINYADLSWLDK
jgi:ATP-dependent DNA helicase DinG